jgi:hypothetical protein
MGQSVFNYENEAIRISIGDVLSYEQAVRDPKTGVDGLVGVARQLRLEVLEGALNGATFTSTSSEILLFKLADNDDKVDHFYLDKADFKLSEAQLGPVSAEQLELIITKLTNLPALALEGLGGQVQLRADTADLVLEDGFRGSLLPVETTPGVHQPGVLGTLNLATGAIELIIQQLEAELKINDTAIFSLSTTSDSQEAGLKITIAADSHPNHAIARITSATGALTLPSIHPLNSESPPSLEITNLAIQADGDLEIGQIDVSLPAGYSHELGLAALLPLEIQTISIAFGAKADGSIDPTDGQFLIEGVLNLDSLKSRLRTLLDAPDLNLSVSSFSEDGILTSVESGGKISIKARLDATKGTIQPHDLPGWLLNISGFPLPVPGATPPMLGAQLLLPGLNAQGQPLPLPLSLVSKLLNDAGSTLNATDVAQTGAQVVGLLEESLQAEESQASQDLILSGGGSLLLTGALSNAADGSSTLSLLGEATLSGELQFPGFSGNSTLNTDFTWSLNSRPDSTGSLTLSGRPALRGARLENSNIQVAGLLEMGVDSISWYGTPQQDQIGSVTTSGLIATGQGMRLSFLEGPLAGLKLGNPNTLLRLYDLDHKDGLADHVYVDGTAVEIKDLTTSWLTADSAGLGLNKMSNLPALTKNNENQAVFTGSIILDIKNGLIGNTVRFAQATGNYDLGQESLNLSLQALTTTLPWLNVSGSGNLQLNLNPNQTSYLTITSTGTIDPGPEGLLPLRGDIELQLDRQGGLTKLKGNVLGGAGGGQLGDLTLNGDLSFSYDPQLDLSTISGNVSLAGVNATGMIVYKPGSGDFSANLKATNQTEIEVTDWLWLTPRDLDIRYQYNPANGSLATLKGSASIKINDVNLDIEADLTARFAAGTNRLALESGTLKLTKPSQGLKIAGFAVDLIADTAGNLPSISLMRENDALVPQLRGAMRLPELQGLTIELTPETGQITYSSAQGWMIEGLEVDLTPSGPLNLGLFTIGDSAKITYNQDTFTVYPDLFIHTNALNKTLAPLARTIDHTIKPIVDPVLQLLKTEINLDSLKDLTPLKPDWIANWVWEPLVNSGKTIHDGLIETLEATPGNPYRDQKLQIVELLDSTSYFIFQLIKDNPSIGRALASQLGLPSDFVDAAIAGTPYISLASSMAVLEAIDNLSQAIRVAEARGDTSSGDFIAVPDLAFRYQLGNLQEILGSIGNVAQNDSAVVKAILDTQSAWRNQKNATNETRNEYTSLLNGSADLSIPLFDDPARFILSALSSEAILDLFKLDLSLDANLGLSYNQKIPIYGIPFVVGTQANVRGHLDAALGISANRNQLKTFANNLELQGLESAVGSFLAPADQQQQGIYLEALPGKPLLSLSPDLRLQAGVDSGLAGLRAFIGAAGKLDIQLANDRLYLGELLQLINADTPITPEQIGRLLGFEANLSAKGGIDVNLAGWKNITTQSYPIYTLKVPRVASGPKVLGQVFLDERIYSQTGDLLEQLNFSLDDREFSTTTDSQGAYRKHSNLDPIQIGNRDGILDYRDGMMLAGERHEESHGSPFQLIDSISGVNIGIPLVGLPGESINLLTTLKYTALLRWKPTSEIAGQPLSPELITAAFAPRLHDVPRGFLQDDFEPYQALASNDPLEARDGLQTLIFSYQHLSAVMTIAALLRQLELDYTNELAWGFRPNRESVDAAELVAFTAYGSAILSRFGKTELDHINALDRFGRTTIAHQFDVTNPEHLRAILKEVLTNYPTKALVTSAASLGLEGVVETDFIELGRSPEQHRRIEDLVETSFGHLLTNLAEGLSAITATVAERLAITEQLSSLIPIPGPQLIAASIAGPKRLVLTELVPGLVDLAKNRNHNEFGQKFASLFYSPTTVDSPDRDYPFLIQASTSATEQRASLQLAPTTALDRAVFTVRLTNREGQAVEAPDYGLTIRFRLGGTAIEGVHYTLPAAHDANLLYVAPGASSASLQLDLLPAFHAAANPLLQVELLSADSGYAVAADAAVVSLQRSNGRSALELDGSRRSFQPQWLAEGIRGGRNQLVAPLSTTNPVLRGVNGKADTFVLRPELHVVPHLENFRPQEGDQLLIDPVALQRLRSSPGMRIHSDTIKARALQELEQRLGPEALGALSGDALAALLEPLLDERDPLPAVRLDQLNTYGGLLFDLVSRRPLALLSDEDENDGTSGRDLAWSALSSDPVLGSISLLPQFSASSTMAGLLTLVDPVDPEGQGKANTLVLRASLSQRAPTTRQVVYVVLEADELDQASTIMSSLDALQSRAKTLLTSLETGDVTIPPELIFTHEIELKTGQSISFFEISSGELDTLTSPSDPRLRLLEPDHSSPSSISSGQSLAFASRSGLAFNVELQDRGPSLDALIGQVQAIAPVLDFTNLGAAPVQATLALGREAAYDSVTGFYRTVDTEGTIRLADGSLLPTSHPDYGKSVLNPDNNLIALSDLKINNRRTSIEHFTLSESGYLAPFAQVKGHTFFAYGPANSDGISHFRSLGTNTFGLEDKLGGGDRDYDDLVLSFSFAQPPVPVI